MRVTGERLLYGPLLHRAGSGRKEEISEESLEALWRLWARNSATEIELLAGAVKGAAPGTTVMLCLDFSEGPQFCFFLCQGKSRQKVIYRGRSLGEGIRLAHSLHGQDSFPYEEQEITQIICSRDL